MKNKTMNMIKACAWIGAGLMMGACSSENEPANQAMVNIRAEISSNECLASRVANTQNDEKATRCVVEIWRDGEKQGVEELSGHEDTGFSLSLALYQGMEYQFYFWADPGEECYEADDLSNVALAAGAQPEVAYWGAITLTPTDKTYDLAVTLTHAVAKVSYLTDTELKAQSDANASSNNSVTMGLGRVYPCFNAHLGEACGTSSARTYARELTSDAAANSTVLSAYAFVDGDVQEVTLKYGVAPQVNVANVPVGTNVHTKLVGDISGQTTLPVTAVISDSWSTTQIEYESEEEDLGGVDLGLSVIWAECNLGASSAAGAGDLYQWGNPTACNLGQEADYAGDHSDGIMKSEFDPATVALGGPWRTPTKEEWEELLTLTTITGSNGRTYRASSGESIYLPYTTTVYLNTGENWSYYWTSSSLDQDTKYAFDLKNKKITTTYTLYYYSMSIRPVRDKK